MAWPEIQRKVRQQGADIDSIYEILTGHGEDLRQIKETLAEHGAKLDEHGAKLDEVLSLLRQLTEGSTPQA